MVSKCEHGRAAVKGACWMLAVLPGVVAIMAFLTLACVSM